MDYKILKHGDKAIPEDVKVFFSCPRCGCQYEMSPTEEIRCSEEKQFDLFFALLCKAFDDPFVSNIVYESNCPECQTLTYSAHLKEI